ncbi:hypothetical protein BFW89_11330 [Pseudomonas synxantha]|nr:hypothetical protein BFW89_11330 [Pseudomonas synxantha]
MTQAAWMNAGHLPDAEGAQLLVDKVLVKPAPPHKARPYTTPQNTEDANVGGGLLPIAVRQSINLYLTHGYREQAPSHIVFL